MMSPRPPHDGYADCELANDTPPVVSLFAPRRPHAVELQFDDADTRRAADRKREAARTAAAMQRNREISEAAAIARRKGFDDGRAHQRTVSRHDPLYWLGIGIVAGMLAAGLVIEYGRAGGAL